MWYTLSELIGTPGLPSSRATIKSIAERDEWQSRLRRGKRGGGIEYAIASLPAKTQQYLCDFAQNGVIQVAGGPSIEITKSSSSIGVVPKAEERDRVISIAGARRDRAVRQSILCEFWEYQERHPKYRVCDAAQRFAQSYNDRSIVMPAQSIIPSFHYTSLIRWNNILSSGKDGYKILCGKYGKRKGLNKIDDLPEVRDFILARLGTRISNLHREIWQEFKDTGFKLFSIATLRRWFEKYKQENRSNWIEVVEGKDAWNNKQRAAFGNASNGIYYANQEIQLDSTPTDILLADGKRYSIIGAIDVYTRRVRLHLAPTSSSSEIVQGLMYKTFTDLGLPSTIKTDRGMDYLSENVKCALRSLGIAHKVCQARSPWMKPYIERLFGTLTRQLETISGYCGHKVSDRKVLTEQLEKEQQFRLTPEQFQAELDAWVTTYESTPHSGIGGLTPIERYQNSTIPIRKVDDLRTLEFLLSVSPDRLGIRTVQKKGVCVDRHYYIAAELANRIGSRVSVKYSINKDAGEMHIYEESSDNTGAYICTAHNAELSGRDLTEVITAAKLEQKASQKISRDLKRVKTTMQETRTKPSDQTMGQLKTVAFSPDVATSAGIEQVKDFIAEIEIAAQLAEPEIRVEAVEVRRENLINLAERQAERDRTAQVDPSLRYKNLRSQISKSTPIDQTDIEWLLNYECTLQGKSAKRFWDTEYGELPNLATATAT